MIEWTQSLIIFAFFLSFFSMLSALIPVSPSFHQAVFDAQHRASRVLLVILIVVCLVFWLALLNHDMSVKGVYESSSVNTPLRYLISALWGSLGGSHLTWLVLLTLLGQVAFSLWRRTNPPVSLLRQALMWQVCILLPLLGILLKVSNPLERLFPLGDYGRGLNPLLQNPYMVIHPPILFSGYSCLFNTFWLSLVSSRVTDPLVYQNLERHLRLWGSIAWFFLTTGIALGCRWAYLELGWGGYWAWDPVENSSLMPWLTLTLALHLIKRSTPLSLIAARYAFAVSFIFTFWGTFLTRSGVVASVHSFAQGLVGPAYLAFIGFLWMIILLGMKHTVPLTLAHPRLSMRDMFYQYGILALSLLLVVTFLGTCGPIFYELITGHKITIQQPFYEAFLPFVSMLIVLGLAGWSYAHLKKPRQSLKWILIPASVAMAFIGWNRPSNVMVTIFLMLLPFVSLIILAHSLEMSTTLMRKLAYIGIHWGVLAFMAGASLGVSNRFQDLDFQKRDVIEIWNYRLLYQGLDFQSQQDEMRVNAKVQVLDLLNPHRALSIEPGRSFYTHDEQWFNEVDVIHAPLYDLYFSLHEFDIGSESVKIRFYINHGMSLVWGGFVSMLIGALVFVALHTGRKKTIAYV